MIFFVFFTDKFTADVEESLEETDSRFKYQEEIIILYILAYS